MITLTKEEAQQVLDALECMNEGAFNAEIKLLRDRLAQPEREPVAWRTDKGATAYCNADFAKSQGWTPIYPPQRNWQGLTDEERNDCLVEADPCEALLDHEAHELMRTVEAKLKEKNT